MSSCDHLTTRQADPRAASTTREFVLPFTVAASLVRDRFGLAEPDTAAWEGEDVPALARRVEMTSVTRAA
ncbi:hypothetical protein [Microbispora bryophytorum]|uniref:hypothetical protein n=1 Tax=Microbispora bryophytorum TaxID=1460882 RepID=UPI0033DE89AA